MHARSFFAALFLLLLAARLCHIEILWAEEDLPMAAAVQMKLGKTLYRDAWFDKPPLLPSLYLAWGVRAGWVLRVAGALYALGACALAHLLARDLWTRREGFWAAGLLGFFLIFDFPSAVIPLAADLTMLAPHIAAVWLAVRGRAFWSGVLVGIAFLINSKALIALAACALWCFPQIVPLALGFVVSNAIAAAWLAARGALLPYFDQVWLWGFLYAGSTFLEHPLRTGVTRTAEWLGFHAALGIAAFWWFAARSETKVEPQHLRLRMAAWAALSFVAAIVGWRFFPRYFFQLLPVMVIAASRGIVLLGRRRVAVLALLLIPLVRFGPRYVVLASDDLASRAHQWSDVAMDQDSRQAANIVRGHSHSGNTLFVWGFRPDLFVYTGLPAGTRFLDSQPLTGVPADRHLTQSAPVETESTRMNREELVRSHPTFVIDGLSLYNPALAINGYENLRAWFTHYREVGRTRTTVVYRLDQNR